MTKSLSTTWLCLLIHVQLLVQRADSEGFRPGSPTSTNSCSNVRPVPEELRSADIMRPNGLDVFYQKYTEAYGIPVVGSSQVADDALKRACYLLRFMLADHGPVRHMVYSLGGRLALIAPNEDAHSIPEHKNYTNPAPAYGATLAIPVSSVKGTNVVCDSSDTYYPESIGIHEIGHILHLIGAKFAIPGWNDRLMDSYTHAKTKGLWHNTYAMTNFKEYFAEALQSYFNENWCVPSADGIHNEICTWGLLRHYDPHVFALIAELFPCNNSFGPVRQHTNAFVPEQEEQQTLQMDCIPYTPRLACPDSDVNCLRWVKGFDGHCQNLTDPNHRHWAPIHCKGSCNTCPNKNTGTVFLLNHYLLILGLTSSFGLSPFWTPS